MKTRIARSLPLLALSAILSLPVLRAQDTDSDLLADSEEVAIGTDPFNSDTDGDGISDRDEVFSYRLISGAFTYEQALDDAFSRGGRLAVIGTPQALNALKRGIQTTPLPSPLPNNYDPAVTLASPLWVGAQDSTVDGLYQWANAGRSGPSRFNGPRIGAAVFGDLSPGSATVRNVVNVNALRVGDPFAATGVPSGTTITAINTAARTLTLSNAVDDILSRRISFVVVDNGGFSYTTPPDVTFSGGAPGVSSIQITNPGVAYSTPPTVAITGGGGNSATGVAVLDGNGQVVAVNLTNRGSGYTSAPTVALNGAVGLTSINVVNAGTGYVNPPTVNIIGGGGTGATAVATVAGGQITGVTLTNPGANYTSNPTISFTPVGGGTGGTATSVRTLATATASLGVGATATAALDNTGRIRSITVTGDGQTYYTTAPTVNITGGNGGGAAARAVLTPLPSANLSQISISQPGSGYTGIPSVTITGGGGTGASAVATVTGGAVTGVAIINPGSGFSSPPTVTLTGGIGLQSITLGAGGSGYVNPPNVNIIGGGGTGASAVASVSGGAVTGITITNPGTNFTGTPNITFTPVGGGTGATATATIGTPAVLVATIIQKAGRAYSANPGSYANWTGDLPGNRLNEAEGVFLNTGTGFTWGTAVMSTPQGYILQLPATNPTLDDTDGDGLSDFDELNNTTFPTNPTLADTDGDGLSDGEELLLGSDPTLADTDGDGLNDLQERDFGSDPTLVDTDGDGLSDFDEFIAGTDPLLVDTDSDGLSDSQEVTLGTNPVLADTDNDGLTDGEEVNIYFTNPLSADTDGDGLADFAELFVHGTSPLLMDTDNDGLTDFEEIRGTGGFTSNPLLVDTDGDLVSDFDEVRAVPPTNPRDATSFPAGSSPTLGDLFTIPTTSLPTQTVSINETFAPFGHRPETDKTGEDGSVAIRDRNGVIVWVDGTGIPAVLPDSALAKTLYVSNTECVVYNNRFNGLYGSRGSNSQIVIHRRAADGSITTSAPIVLNSTVIETSPITPNTFGFTLLASFAFEDGIDSRQRFQSGSNMQGPTFAVRDVDVWDRISVTMYRITWDAQLQNLNGFGSFVLNGSGNLADIQVLGGGSDGSTLLTFTAGFDTYDDVDDTDPGIFKASKDLWWVTWTFNSESPTLSGVWPYYINPADGPQPPETEIGYITNSRLLYSESLDSGFPFFFPTGDYELVDVRKRPSGQVNLANRFALGTGESILPVSTYTRGGLPAFIYTADPAGSSLKLYRVEDSLIQLGNAVALPGRVLPDAAFVRNPRDGSLLIKGEGAAGVLWVPAIVSANTAQVSGLGNPLSLPNSTLALPMFVSSNEAIAWMNSDAPVDIGNGGVVPPAVISHFQARNGLPVRTPLTPPIAGRYVTLPQALSNDPESEGWFITTFEKNGARTALMRTYRMDIASRADRDNDGLTDYEEINIYKTQPGNADTDGDGLLDGQEVRPFQLVDGFFTWESSRQLAQQAGGRLLVLNDRDTGPYGTQPWVGKQEQFRLSLAGRAIRTPYWIGGHDQLVSSNFQWLASGAMIRQWNASTANWAETESGFRARQLNGVSAMTAPTNWEVFQPNNLNNANATEIGTYPDLKWSMAAQTKRQGYVVEFQRSNPLVADSDGDGLNDGFERSFGSNPTNRDTDGDGLVDRLESRNNSSPLLVDTDGDRLTDFQEINPTIRGFASDPTKKDTDGDLWSDYDEITNRPPTNPNDANSKPGGTPPGQGAVGTGHNVVSLEFPAADIAIPVGFSPFGNRTNFNRFGDDDSSMLVDVNGLVLWRNSSGVVRAVPNSEQAAPLIVSNVESIVWDNAFVDFADYQTKPQVAVSIYRVDPATGQIGAPTPVQLQGKEVVETSPITTTSDSYLLVTSEHGLALGGVPAVEDSLFRIYRVTFSGQVQRLSQIEVFDTGPGQTAVSGTRALGHGSDGSLIFSQDGPAFRRVYWVDGTRAGNSSSVWVQLAAATPAQNLAEATRFSRVLYTTRTRVIFEQNVAGLPRLWQQSRNSFTGELIGSATVIPTATNAAFVRLFEISTLTVLGDKRWFYALSDAQNEVIAFQVSNTGVTPVYRAFIPAGIIVDSLALVDKVNPGDGSAVIASDTANVLWLHNSQTGDDQNNATEISGSSFASTMFVKGDELVLWTNAKVGVPRGGKLPPAQVVHYQLLTTSVAQGQADITLVETDLSFLIEGNFVLSSPPFTPQFVEDFDYWLFSTVEKTGDATATIRTYRLASGANADRDGDRLPDVLEERPGVPRTSPNWTSVSDPDTDDDGIPDGLEVQPFRIVTGSFTLEEARVDAIARGGRLAVPDTKAKADAMKRQLSGLFLGRLWIGGGDMEGKKDRPGQREGVYRWVDKKGRFFTNTGKVVGVPFGKYVAWAVGQPSNVGNLDGVQINRNFAWSTASIAKSQGYILETPATKPNLADTDGDGVDDLQEFEDGTNPANKDTDGDGLTDGQEKKLKTDPRNTDTDGDGLSDGQEFNKFNTDPLLADTDGDGLNDGDEVAAGTNPRKRDTDGDRLSDGDEITAGTNPLKRDTDGDGLNDGREVTLGTDPLKKDTDGDGISDFDEVTKGSDPLDDNDPKGLDSDGDGLTNYEELFIYNTNPNRADTDGDGLADALEIKLGTDPNKKDTDRDGVSDYDEVNVTNTNPTVPSFGTGGGGKRVPFNSAAVRGDYEGMVFGPKDGLAFKQSLRLAGNGSFSTSLQGLRRNTSFRGKFNKKGVFVAKRNLAAGLKGAKMSVIKEKNGLYLIRGSYTTVSGGTLFFELRPVSYSRKKSYKTPGTVTFEAARMGNAEGPLGAGVATGTFRSDGKVNFQIYMPDGSRGSFSGPILNGNLIALYSRSPDGSRPVMLGSVAIRNIRNKSDFNGQVRFFTANGARGGLFPSGFDQVRDLRGSRYKPAAVGTLPLSTFRVRDNNANFRWLKGDFDGISKIGTWATDSRIIIPPTQNDSATSSFDRRTGLMIMRYTRTDTARRMNNSVASAFAVVLQKSKSFKGFYTSDRAAAAFVVQPNKGNNPPEITSVSPLSKFVPAAETTYTVSVGTEGAWNVVIPTDVTWITATVASDGGATGPSATTPGDGNGTVTITVALNTTNTRRQANITIAGLNHRLTQEFR